MDQEEVDKKTVKDAWFKCFVSQTEEKVNDQDDIFREEYRSRIDGLLVCGVLTIKDS